MRINEKHKSINYKKIFVRILGLCLAVALVTLGYKYFPKEKTQSSSKFFCDAEQFSKGVFTSKGVEFTTNCIQDTKEFVTGTASCKCEGDKIYGPTLRTEFFEPGDTVFLTLQYKSTGNAKINVVFSSDQKHFHQENISNGVHSNWQKARVKYVIPKDAIGAKWSIYPAKIEGNGPAYFDDLEIGAQVNENDEPVSIVYPTIEMQINSLNFKKIKNKRKEAKKIGLLFSSKDDLVNADLKIEGEEYSCMTRLKGDLLDHLRSDKWSFRVMLDGNETWRGMNIFSIHNSKARSHLAEWTMHELMKSEGIITPKYDFMKFVLNGKNIGIYGYEQHFDNHFLTNNQRLIAPIIRHNDDGYWDNVLGKLKEYEWAESSQIELFNKENDGNEQFMKLFHYGHSQLNDYLKGSKKAEEVFDLEKMAKYYALMEIGHGIHAQLMTNIRFYVNPASGLMEPIGYDFFGDHMPNVNEDWRPVGQWENGQDIIERSRDGYAYMRRLFGDMKFYEMYMKNLELFASEAYLDRKNSEMAEEIKSRNDFINSDPEYANYKFYLKHIFRKAEYTRAKMYPMPNVSLKSYRTTDKLGVVLQGFHYFPLKILGYKTDRQTINLEEPINIDAYSPDSPVKSYVLKADRKPTMIMYQTLGLDSIFYHTVNNGIAPEINIPTQQSQLVVISSDRSISTIGKTHNITTKNWTITKPYLVPNGEELIISKGTTVSFGQGGSITVRGKLLALGTAAEPISIIGTQSKGQGILISQSDEVSQLSHCVFSNLGSYGVAAVNLPASVNIDESDVEFNSCSWIKNNAEVDLILSNAKYKLTSARFFDNAGDAIRSIFSKGHIDNLIIDNYGGQGIVQKGGRINGENWKMKKVLGWGLDIGLMSMINMKNLDIAQSSHALQVGGSSEVVIAGYNGKTAKRDIEVTGKEKPRTKVVLSQATDGDKLDFMVERGAQLLVNGKEKKTK